MDWVYRFDVEAQNGEDSGNVNCASESERQTPTNGHYQQQAWSMGVFQLDAAAVGETDMQLTTPPELSSASVCARLVQDELDSVDELHLSGNAFYRGDPNFRFSAVFQIRDGAYLSGCVQVFFVVHQSIDASFVDDDMNSHQVCVAMFGQCSVHENCGCGDKMTGCLRTQDIECVCRDIAQGPSSCCKDTCAL
ncbi:hypothetical protein FVE85_8888 [Porphyridium purpureum]|uniref:Uncharacterized protein n=1 Tax=Porphyridium purpureum TaxID=35688 RepID=A0A5J4YRM7_PORPP|nr:hypothetical protein FVE85_8888 [Porphyridium purpureum]|eukprot:POR1031..scf296_7